MFLLIYRNSYTQRVYRVIVAWRAKKKERKRVKEDKRNKKEKDRKMKKKGEKNRNSTDSLVGSTRVANNKRAGRPD